MEQPLVRKAFEMAERLHMLAFDVLDRMTVLEARLWDEYDATTIRKTDRQFAGIMHHLAWIKGVKKPDVDRYLPQIRKTRRKKTLAEIKANFDLAVVRSAPRAIHDRQT